MADYAALQQCYSAPASARCLNVFDAAARNGVIELDDYAAFLSAMNAP